MFKNKVKKDKVLPYVNEMRGYIGMRKRRAKITKGEKEALNDIGVILSNMEKAIKEG